METPILTLNTINPSLLSNQETEEATSALESGQVLYFPNYSYPISQENQAQVYSTALLDGRHKNVSFDYQRRQLGGFDKKLQETSTHVTLQQFMQGFAEYSKQLLTHILPAYTDQLRWGRTSYRPAQISGRTSSKRKDDTRLHVDAFPATPVQGQRILRVFCNINPNGEPRVWHLGQPFEQVMNQFSKRLPRYNSKIAQLLKWIKVTKSLRTAYDHYQLHLHDQMKLDEHYQQTVPKIKFDFQPYTTWIVFTDHVSHAALSGQYLLEQTFYLPVSAMLNADHSPFQHWQKERLGV